MVINIDTYDLVLKAATCNLKMPQSLAIQIYTFPELWHYIYTL
jgi:hypothetical protein